MFSSRNCTLVREVLAYSAIRSYPSAICKERQESAAMPSVLKRRKIIDTNSSFQESIATYGKISKHVVLETGKKEVAIPTKSLSESNDVLKRNTLRQEPLKPKKRKPEDVAIPPAAPRTPRKKPYTVKSLETPTKGTRAFLESFVISTPKRHKPSPRTPSKSKSDTPSARNLSPSSHPTKCSRLPQESQDLIAIHSAFLNALSLYYTHHGTASPADIQLLRPSIKRKWSKRAINQEDIRRILGIQQHAIDGANIPRLSLVDYGKNKICVEYDSSASLILPVANLCSTFESNILALQDSAAPFPLAPITPFNPSAISTSPGKGAQRWSDLKAAAISAQPLPTNPDSNPRATNDSLISTKLSTIGSTERANFLLNRIAAKEEYAATQPAPRSAAARARRVALERLEEIIPILEILTGSRSTSAMNLGSSTSDRSTLALLSGPVEANGNRQDSVQLLLGLGPEPRSLAKSFTMGAVVQRLQTSLKHPVAAEEAERCVRLLAEEVAPQWVSITEVGKLVAVRFRGGVKRDECFKMLTHLIQSA